MVAKRAISAYVPKQITLTMTLLVPDNSPLAWQKYSLNCFGTRWKTNRVMNKIKFHKLTRPLKYLVKDLSPNFQSFVSLKTFFGLSYKNFNCFHAAWRGLSLAFNLLVRVDFSIIFFPTQNRLHGGLRFRCTAMGSAVSTCQNMASFKHRREYFSFCTTYFPNLYSSYIFQDLY